MLVNLLSRSRTKKLNSAARLPRSIRKLRACWATQAPLGWAVTPRRATRALAVVAGLTLGAPTDGSRGYRAVMSINPTLPQLAETLARYRFAYLVTIGDDARTHVVPVHPVFAGNILSVRGLGRKTQAHITTQRLITLVWPPTDPSDYSLIIDGVGALHDDELAVTPTRAVLHRPAQRQTTTTGQGCQSDCVELLTAAETTSR